MVVVVVVVVVATKGPANGGSRGWAHKCRYDMQYIISICFVSLRGFVHK
jgi:hypothetical protein